MKFRFSLRMSLLLSFLIFNLLILYTLNYLATSTENRPKTQLIRNLYPGKFEYPGIYPCTEPLNLLIIIHTAPRNYANRQAIRRSWGAKLPPKTRILFIVGESDYVLERNDDIIVANFIDTYNNLTLKSIAMLDWTSNYCQNIKYLLKIDDDVFLNIKLLDEYINKSTIKNNKIVGRLRYNDTPIRWNIFHKNYISKSQYSNDVYPTYATGPAYLMGGSAISLMYKHALNTTWLQNEDILITGIVGGQRLGLALLHNGMFHNEYGKSVPLRFAHKFITIHEVEPKEQRMYLKCSMESKRPKICFNKNVREYFNDFLQFLFGIFILGTGFIMIIVISSIVFVFFSRCFNKNFN